MWVYQVRLLFVSSWKGTVNVVRTCRWLNCLSNKCTRITFDYIWFARGFPSCVGCVIQSYIQYVIQQKNSFQYILGWSIYFISLLNRTINNSIVKIFILIKKKTWFITEVRHKHIYPFSSSSTVNVRDYLRQFNIKVPTEI